MVVDAGVGMARRQPEPLLDAVLDAVDPPLESLPEDEELLLDRPVLLEPLVEPLLDVGELPLESPVELELLLTNTPEAPVPPHAAIVNGTRAARRSA